MEVQDLKEKCKWCLRTNCKDHDIRYFIYSIKSDRDYLKKEIKSVFEVKHIRYFTYCLKSVSLNNFLEKLESIGYEVKDERLSWYLPHGLCFSIINENYFVYLNKNSKKYGRSSPSSFLFILHPYYYKTNISLLFDFIDKYFEGDYIGSNEWKYDTCKGLDIPLVGKLSYLDPPGKYWYKNKLEDKQIYGHTKYIKNKIQK